MLVFGKSKEFDSFSKSKGNLQSIAYRMLLFINYYLYHIILVQEFNDDDCKLRVNFYRWALY